MPPGRHRPFGVRDLVGNVLRRDRLYRPQGAIWYFPQALNNDTHGKLLLMAPSLDRAALVDFGRVVDATPG